VVALLAIGGPAKIQVPSQVPVCDWLPSRTWKRNADCYARYYLSIFADGYRILPIHTTEGALEAWVEELTQPRCLEPVALNDHAATMKGIRSPLRNTK
jgi:hypothetical protein